MSTVWILFVLLPALVAGERFSCRSRILGGYYADVKSGCRAFHVCVRVAGAGVRDFRFFCPPGTLFQQQAQTCTDWGDDDGLACPTDLDDGQFDLYKIGSGFDTKKVSSNPQREEEPEFSLQRAESGDRRLHQDSSPPQQQSDLRAAHSSDFFSGRRDRGRDEPAPTAPPTSPAAPPSTRAPYRRPPPRATQRPTTFVPQPTLQQSFPESPVPYDPQPKRKLVRKRPVHSSTAAPSEFTTASKQYFRSTKPDYEKFTAPQQTPTEVSRSNYNEDSGFVDVVKVSPKAVGRYDAPSDKQRHNDKSGLTEVYNYNAQSTPNYNNNINKNNNLNNNYNQQRNTDFQNQNVNVNNQPNQNFDNQNSNFHNQNRNFNNDQNHLNNDFNNQNDNLNKKSENFNAQNDFKNGRAENRQFKATVRNNFNVAPPADLAYDNEVRKNVEVSPNGVQRSTNNYQEKSSRNIGSSTPAYINYNSVSYDTETKIDPKQSFANTQTTPDYEKRRIMAPLKLNTVAYKTNVGFDARQVNYAESEEDDGQYRLPSNEDDGQYRPELYERDRELLSGAHSLNIAASGNRLPEDQKPRRPSQQSSQAAAPRPFSAVVAPSTQPPRATENYPSTAKPQPRQQQPQTTTANYYQSYSSTGRQETPSPAQTTFEYSNSVFTTRRPTTPAHVPTTTQYSPAPSSFAPQAPSKKPAQDPVKSAPAQKKQHQPQPSFAKPVKSNKEDASYDYAYYDSDTGFSEYEQIEEFGKTKTKL